MCRQQLCDGLLLRTLVPAVPVAFGLVRTVQQAAQHRTTCGPGSSACFETLPMLTSSRSFERTVKWFRWSERLAAAEVLRRSWLQNSRRRHRSAALRSFSSHPTRIRCWQQTVYELPVLACPAAGDGRPRSWQGSFDGYYGEMPWHAMPFERRSEKDALSKKYGVNGIPMYSLPCACRHVDACTIRVAGLSSSTAKEIS